MESWRRRTLLKVIVLGDSGVGKTSLMNQYPSVFGNFGEIFFQLNGCFICFIYSVGLFSLLHSRIGNKSCAVWYTGESIGLRRRLVVSSFFKVFEL